MKIIRLIEDCYKLIENAEEEKAAKKLLRYFKSLSKNEDFEYDIELKQLTLINADLKALSHEERMGLRTDDYIRRIKNQKRAALFSLIRELSNKEQLLLNEEKERRDRSIENFNNSKNAKAIVDLYGSKSSNPIDYYLLGINFMSCGNYSDAVESLSKAIEIDNEMSIFYANKGLAHFMQRDYSKAREMFLNNKEIHPEDALTNMYLCFTNILDENYEEVIKVTDTIQIKKESFEDEDDYLTCLGLLDFFRGISFVAGGNEGQNRSKAVESFNKTINHFKDLEIKEDTEYIPSWTARRINEIIEGKNYWLIRWITDNEYFKVELLPDFIKGSLSFCTNLLVVLAEKYLKKPGEWAIFHPELIQLSEKYEEDLPSKFQMIEEDINYLKKLNNGGEQSV